MKVDVVWNWRRQGAMKLAACCILLATCVLLPGTRAAGPLGPSDRPEAYFNGSSYIRLSRPISLKQVVGLSFRTCVGGELFSQRFEGYTLRVSALFEQVVVQWARPNQPQREVGLEKETLDNHWHVVVLRFRPNPPSLLLEVDKDTQVISNVTWNPELLSPGALEASSAVLVVGGVFSGCMLEGPQLEFGAAAAAQARNVLFGRCPLTTDDCIDRKDVLRIPPKDHCYNEPCMRHGTCISRHDKYECHCTARYAGNNCQMDVGDPCASAPCRNGARCVEDARGDYACHCPPGYLGPLCELEESLDPRCAELPCRHNGSCSVPPGADTYLCACPPGYTGRDCETDVDECAGASLDACQHGGRCVDAVNNFTCDCTATGYTGARCEVNVNECEEDKNICGHGYCYDTYGSFMCACQPGYTGERCHSMSMCAMGPCGAGGACVEESGGAGFRCVCARGWAPPLCAAPLPAPAPAPTPAPACADDACPPRSHCIPNQMVVTGVIAKQVTCVCDIGYYGAPGPSPNCTSLESVCEAGVCQNGATCALASDHFNCTCAPGYKGAYCEQAVGKALSELKAPERCAALPPPCVHAVSCQDLNAGFRCECEPGWSGARCDSPAACREAGECEADCRAAAACGAAQQCVELGGAWRCAAAAADSACASSPCHNGTCLALDTGLFRCQCPPGNNGRLCELDIDECAIRPKICHHGVCVNVPGSYECYCRPGYTGDSCEQDIDECLSSPCKNGGSCQNLENNYDCTCMEGFEGKDCSINIDECEPSPCAAGSTCVDGVASYSCVCQEGLTGPTCETDVDDCRSQPCQHGGRCVDGLNSYACECGGTGFAGDDCGANIDECASQPCRHGGSCLDDVNDYHCACHPAYAGKNCETDIGECEHEPCKFGGVCLERSNASLFVREDATHVLVQVGPQPHMLLPDFFYQPFSYENAAGYECVCVKGTNGSRCEVNIDECQPSQCGPNGKCIDGIGSYTCSCFAGYEGLHCETEIDECARYTPCAHGKCIDGRATYYCQCAAGWGGQNCSVVLQGCRDAPCRHGGACHPWLHLETEHRFNCSCTPGHYGTTCEKITTMSLEKNSYAEVNTSREEGYDIAFRFRTTLSNGLLAMGRGLTYFFLELSNGRLNLHSSLLNKWEGVFIGSNLNDSFWQKVFVTINSSHLVLAANEEQTIYPISQNEAYNSSVTSFPTTRLGTAGSSYATVTHGPNFFVGCLQDVVVNGQWVLPEDANATESEESGEAGEAARALLRGVAAQCPRREQCAPSPCRAGGACLDRWTSFVCTCPRPTLGATCQHSYEPATFGQERARRRAVVRVRVREAARRAVRAALDISMFVRTYKPSGQIFYLGSDESLVGAALQGGELLVQLRFNQTPENYTVGGTRLDNGFTHLIQVVRNATLVQVKLNGTEYFRKSISAAKQIDAQVLYLGGPPPPAAEAPAGASPPAASTAAPEIPPGDTDDAAYFKGIIQDVQISNGVNVSIVEFFPLLAEGLSLPPPFGEVSLDRAGVLRGVVTDDVCARAPCHHNATCTNTWNDYVCQCPRGYKGKQCSEVEFCQLQGCPSNSYCRNLDAGYECVSNATFDGTNTTLTYKLREPPRAAPPAPLAPLPPRPAQRDLPDSLTITYRSKTGGTLFHAESTVEGYKSWFTVGVFKEQVSVQWRLGGAPLPTLRRLRASHSHLHWTTLRFSFAHDTLRGAFIEPSGHEEQTISAPLDTRAWQELVMGGRVHLGGIPHSRADTTTTTALPQTTMESSTDPNVWEYSEGEEVIGDNLAGEFFKGCMGAVHVGGLLLPFFTEEQLFVGNTAALLAAQPHYALLSGRPYGATADVGCVLCLESDCTNGGHCQNVKTSYDCSCPAGYDGDYCQVDVDECVAHQCQSGATCQDGVAGYTCLCPLGFSGDLCETDVDECASGPCQHGGTCTDGAGAFSCACAAAWSGAACELPRLRTCAHRPCAAARACRDVPPEPPTGNNFTCECLPDFEGVYCESAFCELEPCVHGDCVHDNKTARCACADGYEGRLCERERDACADGAAATCLHGGRCVSLRGSLLCDCTRTGWTGARCEVDVDECAAGAAACRPGECLNLNGSYTCVCPAGRCGHACALRDPCAPRNASGPCLHGGRCQQRCAALADYSCTCVDGWGGRNCSARAEAAAEGGSAGVLIGVGAALLGLALGAAALGGLGAQARRKRATRGTYSPSGQEYCNPRHEKAHAALKPPPEERLI